MSSRSFCAISQKRCACSSRIGSRRTTMPSSVTGNTIFRGAATKLMLSSFRTVAFASLSRNGALWVRSQPLSMGVSPITAVQAKRGISRDVALSPLLSCISRPFQASLLRRGIPSTKTVTCDDFTRPTIGHATRDPAMLSGEPSVKAHCLPFSQIPHTTRLFSDFLAYLPNVQPFYPRSPHFEEWLKEEAAKISYDSTRRERVTAILERQNRSWNASPQTLANLDRLRKGAAAGVTGQQVGLFGGPMFAIYKALTAVKLAEEATAAGIDTVPIFWL